MTQDEIIEMARQADWPDSLIAPIIMAKLNDFAKLVAAKEREACLKLAEKYQDHWTIEAIRARGEA
jgi:hypothetical protein